MAGVNARAKSGAKTFRVVVIALASVYFLLPLVSLADFSVRFPLTGRWTPTPGSR